MRLTTTIRNVALDRLKAELRTLHPVSEIGFGSGISIHGVSSKTALPHGPRLCREAISRRNGIQLSGVQIFNPPLDNAHSAARFHHSRVPICCTCQIKVSRAQQRETSDGSSSTAAKSSSRGFALIDLSIAIAVLSFLSILVTGFLTKSHSKRMEAVCLANLHQIASAIHEFSQANNGNLPGPVVGQRGDFWWFYKDQISSYVKPTSSPSGTTSEVYACPADRGYSDPKPFFKTPRFNETSYVFNGVGLPGIPNIAGWKQDSIHQPKHTLLVMEWSAHAPLSWHRSRTGKKNAPFYNNAENVVAFADGRAAIIPIHYDGFNAAYTRDPIGGYDYKYSGGPNQQKL